MSNTKRLTPGQTTAGVLFLSSVILVIASVVLAIMACNNAVIVSGRVHFAVFLLSLFSGLATGIFAAAADDGLFTWPKGGTADPPPPALLPSIEWSRSGETTQIVYYIWSVIFGIWTVALMIASVVQHPAILFSTGSHFFACVISLLLGCFFLKRGAAVEDRRNNNTNAAEGTSVLMAVIMVACFAIVSIAAANNHVLFFPEFAFGVCVLTLAMAGIALFAAGRAADRGKQKQTFTSNYLFGISAGLAVEAIIAALISVKMVLFSAGFHIALVGIVGLMSGGAALWAALLRDRDAS